MGLLSTERAMGKAYSKMDFSDGPLQQPPPSFVVPLTPASGSFAPRRNKSEKERLQGLMRPSSVLSLGDLNYSSAALAPASSRDRFRAWMVNEGLSWILKPSNSVSLTL